MSPALPQQSPHAGAAAGARNASTAVGQQNPRRRALLHRALPAFGAITLACTGLIAASPLSAAQAAAAPSVITSEGTTWQYNETDTDPAAGLSDRLAWTKAGFDTSAWKSGTGSFGAKNETTSGMGGGYAVDTLLKQKVTRDGASVDVRTYHFRTTITLTQDDFDAAGEYTGSMVFDDAVQVFANGTKVAGFVDDKVEAAPESERNLMYAGNNAGDPVQQNVTIPKSALHVGENVISVALYQDRAASSDIYFDFEDLHAQDTDAVSADVSDLVMTVGSDETERNLAWYSKADTAQTVQIAPGTDASAAFPANPTTVASTGAVTTSGEYNHFATVTGLKAGTGYVYRVGSDETGWSTPVAFTTGSSSKDFEFLFVGDPQIGASGNRLSDQAGWEDTLDVATAANPDSELIFSAGDQVNTASNEDEYASFLAPEQLQTLPLVPVNGNHDVGSKAYQQHYNVPNFDATAGAATSGSSSGGDYWYTYKGVLFVVLNSNNSDLAAHESFMRQVVAEHGADARWSVLAFHHSIYSIAAHVNDSAIVKMREAFPTVISDLGFDLVLQGHDHSYTRTYLIKDGQLPSSASALAASESSSTSVLSVDADATEDAADVEQPGQSQVQAEDGEVLYVTANSASGSKYYDITAPNAWYASVINQDYVRNYSTIEVTDDSLTISTLRSEAHGEDGVNSLVDQVTLTRASDAAEETPAPSETESPEASQTPEASETPGGSESPEASETPAASETPEASETPDAGSSESAEPTDTTQAPEEGATEGTGGGDSDGGTATESTESGAASSAATQSSNGTDVLGVATDASDDAGTETATDDTADQDSTVSEDQEGSLASTGATVTWIAALALGLSGLGAATLAATRRRRTH